MQSPHPYTHTLSVCSISAHLNTHTPDANYFHLTKHNESELVSASMADHIWPGLLTTTLAFPMNLCRPGREERVQWLATSPVICIERVLNVRDRFHDPGLTDNATQRTRRGTMIRHWLSMWPFLCPLGKKDFTHRELIVLGLWGTDSVGRCREEYILILSYYGQY